MKNILITFLFILILFSGNHPGFGQIDYNEINWGVQPMDYSSVGTVGWQFLKLPTNARNAALGGVNSSIGHGDANAALTNPASTADVANFDLSFSHMNWVADIGYQSFAMVKNFNNWGVVGLNFIYVDYGEELRTEYQEEVLVTGTIYTPVIDGLGTFDAGDLAIGMTYARQITDKLQVGGNLRFIQERIDDAKTSTWSLDIGTVFNTGYKTLRVSMLGRHFGPDAEFRDYKDRIQKTPFRIKTPMQLSLGAAMDLLEESATSPHRWTVALEYILPNDGSKKVNFGSEYVFMKMFSLRAGYRFNYDEEGLTLGGGLNYELQGRKINLDYAYLAVGIFNQVHLFSFGIHL